MLIAIQQKNWIIINQTVPSELEDFEVIKTSINPRKITDAFTCIYDIQMTINALISLRICICVM